MAANGEVKSFFWGGTCRKRLFELEINNKLITQNSQTNLYVCKYVKRFVLNPKFCIVVIVCPERHSNKNEISFVKKRPQKQLRSPNTMQKEDETGTALNR